MTLDEQIGRAVLRVTCTSRGADERFPLTGGWIQFKASQLGFHVGEHRALRIARDLEQKGLIVPAGSYRQGYRISHPSGWRVRLFRLSNHRPRLRKSLYPQVKVWWRHPLFGLQLETWPGWLTGGDRLRGWKELPR